MNRLLGSALGIVLLAGCIVQAAGQTLIPLSGKICAFDPTDSWIVAHMDTDYRQLIILDTGKKDADRFVKVEVLAFRKYPLPAEVFDGKHDISLNAVRSEGCDEGRPRIWNPPIANKKGKITFTAGSYMPTGAYDRHDLERITHLTCFTARTDKQQSAAQPVIDPKTGDLHFSIPVATAKPKQ
jgi:hypothetical protein